MRSHEIHDCPPFIDTNILLYAGSNAAADGPKRRIASSLLAELDFCLSSQVVQEYLSNALGKKPPSLLPRRALAVRFSIRRTPATARNTVASEW